MLAIVDERAPTDLEDRLVKYGHRVLRLPPHPILPFPIASHPDMLLFFADEAVYCTSSYYRLARKELETISASCGKPIRTVCAEYGARYPQDILLNAARVGEHLFCKPSATARELTMQPLLHVSPVHQGYAKCSIVPVGGNALISADVSIIAAAQRAGLETLQVCPDHITLKGYDYGFLGGATSYAPYGGTTDILFCGSLSLYPDGDRMRAFCKKHGFTLKDCNDLLPIDVGTVFLV